MSIDELIPGMWYKSPHGYYFKFVRKREELNGIEAEFLTNTRHYKAYTILNTYFWEQGKEEYPAEGYNEEFDKEYYINTYEIY